MLISIFTVLACAPPDYVGPEEALPSITILFPNPDFFSEADEGRPICPQFQVVVQVENFELEDPSSDDVLGQGHWHLYLDDPDLVNYLVVGDDAVVDLPSPLTEGNHTLYAALRENSHGPLPEEQTGEDVSLSEITVADTEDCMGNQVEGS